MLSTMKKRGVSPLVATVLLIALTIAAFTAIFAWSRGFITEQIEKNGGLINTQCQSIAFDSVLQGNGQAYVTNKGNIVIYAFNVKGETAGTSKIYYSRPSSGKLGIGEVDTIDLGTASGADTITLIPILLGRGTNSGTGKLFTCSDQAKVIK